MLDDIFGEIKPKSAFSSSTMSIIMGHCGVGKTTLATTASELGDTVLVNFENRVGHIDETDSFRIYPQSKGDYREDKTCTYDQFQSFVSAIISGKLKPSYIIIDTLDAMFDTILKNKMQAGGDKRMAYNIAYEEMNALFKVLKNTGINIICTSHVLNDPVLNKMTISLNEKLRNKINDQTDNIFLYKTLEDESRVLRLKSDDTVVCKLTVNGKDKYNSTIQELIDPSWVDVQSILSEQLIIPEPSKKEDNSQIKQDYLSYLKDNGITDVKLFNKNNGISGKDLEKITFLMENKNGLDTMIQDFING